MSIDPRTMKELLQLNIMRSLDLTASSLQANSDASAGSSMDFEMLLQQMMQSSPSSGTAMPSVSRAWTSLPYGVSAHKISSAPSAAPASSHEAVEKPHKSSAAYQDVVNYYSDKYKVDASLINGVIHTESGFNPNATSHAGAKGLMQLMDGTARGLGVTNSYDPEQNIEGGTKFLSYLLKKYQGNTEVALAAYNAGPGRIDRLGISTNAELREKLHLLPKETQRYVDKVIQARAKYIL